MHIFEFSCILMEKYRIDQKVNPALITVTTKEYQLYNKTQLLDSKLQSNNWVVNCSIIGASLLNIILLLYCYIVKYLIIVGFMPVRNILLLQGLNFWWLKLNF